MNFCQARSRFLAVARIAAWLLLAPALLVGQSKRPLPEPGSLILRLREGVTQKEMQGVIAECANRIGATAQMRSFLNGKTATSLLAANRLNRYVVVNLDSAAAVAPLLSQLALQPQVELAFANRTYRVDGFRNDSLYGRQWGLRKLEIEAAWERTEGDSSVIVGVVDTGIDFLHPDLLPSLWINPAEDRNGNHQFDPWPASETREGIAGDFDGVDQDENGIPDDVIGFDFVDQTALNVGDWTGRDPVPFDPLSGEFNAHGTNVAGIIAAAADNQIGVAGVAPRTRLLALRAFDSRGNGEDDDISAAIIYAADRGAKVINMSFGDSYYSPLMHDAIRYAYQRGCVLVGSSGNDGGVFNHYPSNYPEVISVSATDSNDVRTSFSTSGSHVSLAAPGSSIATTNTFGRYSTSFGGTSAAAPFVAGVAGLLRTLHPTWTPDEIRTVMELTADDRRNDGWDIDYGAGRVNARRAVNFPGPAEVALTNPPAETGFRRDTAVAVIGSVMAPLLDWWELSYGLGETPKEWKPIGKRGRKGLMRDTLGSFSTAGLPDTTLTLRLTLALTDGRQTERRARLFVDHTAPKFTAPVEVANIWRFDRRAVALLFRTDDLTRTGVYLRPTASPNIPWRLLDLEPEKSLFTRTHYLYLTDQELERGVGYDAYVIAVNSAGDTALHGSASAPLNVMLEPDAMPTNTLVEAGPVLPYGYPLDQTAQMYADGKSCFLLNRFNAGQFDKLIAYSFDGTAFTPRDSTGNWAPRGLGDSDGNGLLEVFGQSAGQGVVFEQATVGGSPFATIKFADTTSGGFYPSGTFDFDNDGTMELIVRSREPDTAGSYFYILKWGGTGYQQIARLDNPTPPAVPGGKNSFSNSESVLADFDGNGRMEVLLADDDNDFMAYERGDDGVFRLVWTKLNNGSGNAPLIGAVNFAGRSLILTAVASSPFMNNDREYEAPYWQVNAYLRFTDGTDSLVWSQRFAYRQISGGFRNAIGGVNLASGRKQYLALSLFPNVYLFDGNALGTAIKPVWWTYGPINYRLFTVPLGNGDQRGLGIGDGDSIRFYRLDSSYIRGAEPALALSGWAVSDSAITLSWLGPEASGYSFAVLSGQVLPGSESISLQEIQRTNNRTTIDAGAGMPDGKLKSGGRYAYLVRAINIATGEVAAASNLLVVTAHQPARLVAARAASSESLLLHFSYPMRQSTERAGAVLVRDLQSGQELPVSSVIAASDSTLLVRFSAPHPGRIVQVQPTYLLRDRDGSPADTASSVTVEFPAPADGAPFIAARASKTGEHQISVEFNRQPDPATATDISNYQLDPPGAILAVAIDPVDPQRALLSLPDSYQLAPLGRPYLVTVKGVKDLQGKEIGDGAGSVVGFTLEGSDLSGAFAYPQPFSLLKDERVAFGGLTRTATVTIFTQSGGAIATLQSHAGDQLVSWDGRASNGDVVPTGIYLYLVQGTNQAGEAVESGVKKLVVMP